MNSTTLLSMSAMLTLLLIPQMIFPQAMGEYGRTLGGVSQRKGNAMPKASTAHRKSAKGKAVLQGIGDLGHRPVPFGLTVVSRQAGLYSRQDDEAEKIDQLFEGDTLVPMVHSIGGSEWYMVKTSKGLIGWVKSADIREQTAKTQ
jgi:hypothetical protein